MIQKQINEEKLTLQNLTNNLKKNITGEDLNDVKKDITALQAEAFKKAKNIADLRISNIADPEVKKYVQERDIYLAQLNTSRDDAKSEIIRVFYGGRNTNPFLEPLAKEVRTFTKFLIKMGDYNDLFEAVKHEDNIYGTFLSYILQTEERICMLSLKSILETRGYTVDVLAYDGVMVRKGETVYFNDNILEDIQTEIYEKTGYELTLLIKPFSYYEIDDEGEICAEVS